MSHHMRLMFVCTVSLPWSDASEAGVHEMGSHEGLARGGGWVVLYIL